MRRVRRSLLVAAVLAVPAPAAAAPPPEPYGSGDHGGFRYAMPPGNAGTDNAVQAAGFLATGTRPAHFADGVAPYDGLLAASPGLDGARLDRLFRDATFGVPTGGAESMETPRQDVTIERDRATGAPHVYGATRSGVMFGAGYAAAEDRLFLMDVLRHLGRATLSSFLGGSAAYRSLDAGQWRAAPYAGAELEAQYRALDRLGPDGAQARRDLADYLDGINAYVGAARLDPLLMPFEYAAIGRPLGPDPWTPGDLVATASVIGARLGANDADELGWAQTLVDFRARFGARAGRALWQALRAPADPESPDTVLGRRFPFEPVPARPRRGSVALPDPGSVRDAPVAAGSAPATGPDGLSALGRGLAGGLRGLVDGGSMSNALLVSARASASGRPLAVFGPQVGYLAPSLLEVEDLHGPGIDVQGVAIPGAAPYVVMGHGPDYAWSATSAHDDVIDVYAVPLCRPDGSPPPLDSAFYEFRGRCLAMETLSHVNASTPNLLDHTPAGSVTLTAQRTAMGLVIARATVSGRPVAFTRLRSTYRHELDSAAAFGVLDDPARVPDARSFQRAAARVGYAFNWFYADDRDIAYINSNADTPLRPRGIDPLLPVWSRFEWPGYDPRDNTARTLPFARMPQVVDQRYIVNWNNRQAAGFTFTDPGRTSVFRSQLLERRVRALIAGSRRATLPGLVDAAQDAATVDLRGDSDLGPVLAVLGRPRDPALRSAVAELAAWRADGAHRIDRDGDGVYEHARAIEIMDAWWPRLVRAELEPVLGPRLLADLRARLAPDDPPGGGGAHRGSAYEDGWYGYVSKDLRTLLGEPVRGPYPRVLCGHGNRARCRAALAASLRAALAVTPARLYGDDPACARLPEGRMAPCHDEIRFQAASAIAEPPIPWQNRPTYQQVVEVRGHRPR